MNPQGPTQKPVNAPGTTLSTKFKSGQTCPTGGQSVVDGTSGQLTSFNKAVHEELQEPVHSEAHDFGTLLFVRVGGGSGKAAPGTARTSGSPRRVCSVGFQLKGRADGPVPVLGDKAGVTQMSYNFKVIGLRH